MNLQRNSSFVNWMRFPLLCEKSGAILLVLVGLTACWQSDEIQVNFKIFLQITSLGFSPSLTKVQCYYSDTNGF